MPLISHRAIRQDAAPSTMRRSLRDREQHRPEFDWGVIEWKEGGVRNYEERRAKVHEAFSSVCKALRDDYNKVVKFFESGPDEDGSRW